MRTLGFKDQRRSAQSGTRARAAPTVGARATRSEREKSRCETRGHRPRLKSSTKTDPHLSPSLRDCYADPIEVALEEHTRLLPVVIADPGTFTTQHVYDNPRDPDAWPKNVKVTTLCKAGRLMTLVHKPSETLSVFDGRLP